MSLTLDLPDDVLARLRSEARRRGVSLDTLVAELAAALPEPEDPETPRRKLGFFALGSSTDGRSAADADEILAEGFGQD